MDRRTFLPAGTRLDFPGMHCTIESEVGRGSNALVYLGSYPDQHQPGLRHRVLVKELFPYHPRSAIYRDGQNQICVDAEGADTMHLHRISFERGNEIHIRLLGDHPGDADSNINTFSMNHTLYSILGYSGGRSLDKELEMPGADKMPLTLHIRRMLCALRVLEAFHESGYIHLDISPDNIILIGDGKKERFSLIDYNSVHTIEEIRSEREVYFSAKEGYSAPEIRMERIGRIGPPADLYAISSVFYRCITGRCLSPLEMVRQAVPDLSGAKCLEGVPDTVLSMVRHIFRRGLASVSTRRYQNTAAMCRDLEELQDRIDGRGITHWALWETGRADLLHTIKTNPAFGYIQDTEKVYPVVGALADGTPVTLTKGFCGLRNAEVVRRLTNTEAAQKHGQGRQEAVGKCNPGSGNTTYENSEESVPGIWNGESAILLGSGGMGKTTALLRMAYLQPPGYSPAEPAVIYISLYGWNSSGRNYIKNRILESLRFKPETDSMETAKHELLRLFSSPAHTPWGERPRLLLLLDGLNEASGELEELVREISELSEMPGLKILLTSRSPVVGLNLPEISLRRLAEPEVASILSESGILLPENKELRQLLRTPMMLSIFIRTILDGEKQLFVEGQESREYLLSAYLSAMLEKEARNTPEDSTKRWRAEAAVHYLLPEIACFLKNRETSVSDKELLPLVQKCFRRLSKRDMTVIFPQWIGHLSDIKGGAENPEEWYGLMVHNILWRRLGLLIREENGHYRSVHQLLEEYLAECCQGFERRFLRRQRIRTGIASMFCILLAGMAWKWIYLPWQSIRAVEEVKAHYDEAIADKVLSMAFLSYINSAKQYESVRNVLECLQEENADGEEYGYNLSECRETLASASSDYTDRARGYAKSLLETGEVMPWSEEPLDTEALEDWMPMSSKQAGDYERYLEILDELKNDAELWDKFGTSYVEAFSEAITSDAYVTGKYYKILIEPELDEMEKSGSEEYRNHCRQYLSAAADYPLQNEITKETDDYPLEQYQRNQVKVWQGFRTNAAIKLIGESDCE